MKTLTLLLATLLASTAAAQQVFVEYNWTQPDSTVGSTVEGGQVVGKMAIPDGWIASYEIMVAADTDTTIYGTIDAPVAIAELGRAVIPIQFNKATSVRVRAIDQDGRVSDFGEWSDPFTVDPGKPVPPGKPNVLRVFLGG